MLLAGAYQLDQHQVGMSYVYAARRHACSGSAVDDIDTPDGQHVLGSLRDSLDNITFSTSFSGVDTPSTSFLMIAMYINAMLGLGVELPSLPAFTNLWACEWFSPSRTELQNHPHGPMHIFDDIGSFWTKTVHDRLSSLVNFALVNKVLIPLVMAGDAVSPYAYCHCCGHMCRAPCLVLNYSFISCS
jgi:hypothetical protein